jgi:hypothetical protein
MEVGGQCHATDVLPPGITHYPLYRRLGGPQGQSRWMWKILLLPQFNPQTVQTIASCYIDFAMLALTVCLLVPNILLNMSLNTLHLPFLLRVR